MTVDLMKPRYRVIADYPGNTVPVGFVYIASTGKFGEAENYFDKYPHLFKPLQWWEDRDEKDMPEYVKNSREEIVKVVGLESNGLFYEKKNSMEGKMWTRYSSCTPATLTEYEQYLSQSKTDI